MTLINERRRTTSDRLVELSKLLIAGDWRMPPFGCVYATGSFGRGEASSSSDLDLFIVSNPPKDNAQPDKEREKIRRLDLYCVTADLIRATGSLGIPPFDSDGEYLVHYEVEHLVHSVGKPYDDAFNTFTARLLLLLESTPLIGKDTYTEAVESVIKAYWRDYDGHEADFIPAYLANDILRLWRTFCVNYEARTEVQPAAKNIKRRVKNYKLKHARLLTCYSALFYLLHKFEESGTVTKDDARHMVSMMPTERLEFLMKTASPATNDLRGLLEMYTDYLQSVDNSERLLDDFRDAELFRKRIDSANAFGDCAAEVIKKLGAGTRLHRMLLV